MIRPVVRGILVGFLVAGGLGAGMVAARGSPSGNTGPEPARGSPSLPAPVIAATSTADGRVLRVDGSVRIERVAVPTSLRAQGVADAVYRVRIEGSFPPRALRYVVTAAGRPVAFGTPSARVDELVAITADPAVLTETIAVRYGGDDVGPGDGPVMVGRSSDGGAGIGARGVFGPLRVTERSYDLGDEVFQPSGLVGKVELRADVHYPKALPGGPYPLVLFLHGNHSSCYRQVRVSYTWPCRDGWKPLPNHEGYDYVAARLASYGFVVVSVSANGVNVLGNQVGDTGMRQRGELLERHLELWRDWASTGGDPFGSRFVGRVDLTRIGAMGHSRGGEGAVWQGIVDRERPDPFGIDAILALAPVDFTRETVNEVPMAVMLPYCDGDVSDLQGIHLFDDARYRAPGDPTPKQTVTIVGANHNFFNLVWSPSGGYPGSFDDGTPHCEDRLRAVEQRRIASAYIVSFFRRYVAGVRSQDPIWTGERTPRGVAPARTLTSYLAPDTWRQRLDVDRFADPGSLSVNQLGGSVVGKGLSTYDWCANTLQSRCVLGRFAFSDIHLPGLARGIFGWEQPQASVRFRLPAAAGGVRRFDAVQMRISIDPSKARGSRSSDVVMTLIDGDGNRDGVAASAVGDEALEFPSRLRRLEGHLILQQLRFPLETFHGVDLTDIRILRLRFPRPATGAIHVADLAFSSGAPPPGG